MKIAFGLYNQLSHRSASYREHLRNITMFGLKVTLSACRSKEGEVAFFEENSVTQLLQRARDLGVSHLLVVSMGYQSHSHELIFQIIREAESKSYPLVGHILEDKPKGYYQLHPQCLYINVNAWVEIGSPEFGNTDHWNNITLSIPDRSLENIHHDYTPTYLKPTKKKISYSGPLREGYFLISAFLSAGYSIGNFSLEVRNQKYHIYPEIDDLRFEKILAGEKDLQLEENGPTGGQFRYLRDTEFRNFQNTVYVFNNDDMNANCIQYRTDTKLDTLYAVAAGFKPIQLLTLTDWTGARVVYVDYAQPALDFKKWLLKTWDGKDYLKKIGEYKRIFPDFSDNWLPEKDYTPQWKKTLELFGGERAWLRIWNQYKELPHRFIRTNFFNEYQEMLDDMQVHQGNNMFWFSNSFFTSASVRNFPPSALDRLWKKFIGNLILSNRSIQLGGCSNLGEGSWMHYGKVQ